MESVCLAFSRLVDSFTSDPKRLEEIASSELLSNLQQLVSQPFNMCLLCTSCFRFSEVFGVLVGRYSSGCQHWHVHFGAADVGSTVLTLS